MEDKDGCMVAWEARNHDGAISAAGVAEGTLVVVSASRVGSVAGGKSGIAAMALSTSGSVYWVDAGVRSRTGRCGRESGGASVIGDAAQIGSSMGADTGGATSFSAIKTSEDEEGGRGTTWSPLEASHVLRGLCKAWS